MLLLTSMLLIVVVVVLVAKNSLIESLGTQRELVRATSPFDN